MADVTERMLALLATLQSGRSFSGPELADRLGVSGRTLRRDISRLRGYGYPVRTQPGPGGHYLLAAGAALPPLTFDDDEAVATLVALAAFAGGGPLATGAVQDAATRAYATLDQFLPARLRPRLAALRSSLETSAAGTPPVSAEQLAVLGEAIVAREVVTFGYTDAQGAGTARRVEPYRHVHHLLRWYLLAWDIGRSAWRVFRLDRVDDLRRTAKHFAPRPLPAESALEYLRQGLHRDRREVCVVVEAPTGRVLEVFGYDDVEVQQIDEVRTRLTVAIDTWQRLVLGLAFLDADFTVSSEAELAAPFREFGARLLAATDRDR
ncbi:helix-turn-helix transcriptional regulator [Ruania zhangjianzhongii]|uniref:helix-turn-helix transcriptional regulator n=1 Tax=Ruania zhangjianzhongii TaxID=2603206 RepID=UPI0011C9A235|nr:WYL domain-containing protein [Ruania zhangjianzhongii]